MKEPVFGIEGQVAIYPFTRQAKGDEVVIGRLDTQTFLALPAEAVGILDDLAAGKTVAESSARYSETYGEIPDMEGLLSVLSDHGFVRLLGAEQGGGALSAADWIATPGKHRPSKRHFTRLSQRLARRIFSPWSLAVALVICALAAAAAVAQPALLPGRNSLYFPEHRSFYIVTLVLWGYATVFLHEMAHLVAARAGGVESSLGLSHRMYVLVAETDLTGLWALPKRQRYLPILAGPLLDLVSASLLLLLLFADARSWLTLPEFVGRLSRAMVFSYFVRILWQFYFFLRTDFYYIVVIAFDCGNLMADTEVFLRNRAAKFLPFLSSRPEAVLSPGELRVVRAYAPIWVVGRLLAMASLGFVFFPVMIRYTLELEAALAAGYSADPRAFLEGLLLTCIVPLPFFAGLVLWMSSLFKAWRARNDRPEELPT